LPERGDHAAADLHRRESVAHERAAMASAQTAALYRHRIVSVRALRAGHEHG
jgi:hypothetical protein